MTSPFLDEEWLRVIFPLLNRRELRLCVAIESLAGGAASPAELGKLVPPDKIAPAAVRHDLAQLERAGVIWRAAAAKGRCRFGFLPDLQQAERRLLRAGRRPAAARRAAA